MSEPTPAAVLADSSDALAALTPAQRDQWRMTGEIPTSEPAPSAESASAAPSDVSDPAETTAGAPVESSVESDAADEAVPQTPSEPKKLGNPRKDREARMFQAIERERAATARAEAAERRAAELEAKLKTPESAPPAPASDTAPGPAGKPKLADFLDQPDPYEAHAEAMAEWKADQKLQQFRQELESRAQADAIRQRRGKLFEQTVAKYPDFAERLQDPDVYNLPIPEFVWNAIEKSSASTEILHHFSERPDEARRIAALDPVAALLELGKFSAGASAAVPSPAPHPSAPPPPLTLGSRPSQPEDSVTSAVAAGDFLRYKHAANRRELAGKR